MQLNEKLLKELPRVLFMTHGAISKQSNIAIATWYRIVQTPSKISVQQLLDLANGLQVPVSRFISMDDKNKVSQHKDYIVYSGYKKCYYDRDAIQKVISSGMISSYRDAAPFVGLHPNRVKESLLAIHRLPVVRLLKFCTTFTLNVFDFIVDPNSPNANVKEQKEITAQSSEYAAILHDIATLLREQAIFREEVRRDIAKLVEKMDLMLGVNKGRSSYRKAEQTAVLARQVAKEAQNHADKNLKSKITKKEA
ncbi:MAG: hypothetical protein K5778_02830 [Bacteroidaceae bacterium]|nr:hypothetical protein [Bacteroidaceae bacterium]